MALSNSEMPRPPHPDLSTLSAFADGRLSESERAVFVDHLTGCSECRSTLAALARGLSPRAHRFRGATAWLSLAATLMLVTAVGTLVWRADRDEPPPVAAPSAAPATAPAAPPNPVAAPERPAVVPQTAPAPAAPSPSLAERRGAVRTISGKTFRLVAGEWIDEAYDPLGLLPVERSSNPRERAALLARVPALKPFADIGTRVVVVHDGIVYRLGT